MRAIFMIYRVHLAAVEYRLLLKSRCYGHENNVVYTHLGLLVFTLIIIDTYMQYSCTHEMLLLISMPAE